MKQYITPSFAYKGTRIAILQIGSSKGDTFKIMKKSLNYIRGQNVESWRVMGSASSFDRLEPCVEKFASMVNGDRKSRGKSPINITAE